MTYAQRVIDLGAPEFFRPVPPVALRHPNQRWLLVSGLQKAIRFGLVDDAALMAAGLLELAPSYLRNRLPIIAMEDIGPANLPLVQAIVSLPRRGRACGEQIVGVVAAMAESPKSRLATEMEVSTAYVSGALRRADLHLDEVLAHLRDDPSVATIQNAALLMTELANAGGFDRLFAAMAMEEDDRRSVSNAVRFKNMAAIMAAAIVLVRVRPDVYAAGGGGVRVPVPAAKIGDVLAAAADKYTVVGKRAFAYALKAIPAYGEFLHEARVPRERWMMPRSHRSGPGCGNADGRDAGSTSTRANVPTMSCGRKRYCLRAGTVSPSAGGDAIYGCLQSSAAVRGKLRDQQSVDRRA